mgnify:CR=1 FL=1
MAIILITGGNKGLGYETARRLILQGHKVYIGSRNLERGQRAANDLGATCLSIDVTNDSSVQAAAKTFEGLESHLDVLINNAGISGGMITPDELVVETMQKTFDTNVFGIVRMIHAFMPILQKSTTPAIVNVSSGLGSFGTVLNPSTVESKIHFAHYSASKAAVNMLTLQYAKALPEVHVNAVDPGYTATDFNQHSGPQNVVQGTDAIVRMATNGIDRQNGQTGTLSNRHGTMPW